MENMIKLNFSPVNEDVKTECSIRGTVITVDGETTDLSTLPDGATGSTDKLMEVTRTGDDYEVTIKLAHLTNAPRETRFPEAIEVTEESFTLDYNFGSVK